MGIYSTSRGIPDLVRIFSTLFMLILTRWRISEAFIWRSSDITACFQGGSRLPLITVSSIMQSSSLQCLIVAATQVGWETNCDSARLSISRGLYDSRASALLDFRSFALLNFCLFQLPDYGTLELLPSFFVFETLVLLWLSNFRASELPSFRLPHTIHDSRITAF